MDFNDKKFWYSIMFKKEGFYSHSLYVFVKFNGNSELYKISPVLYVVYIQFNPTHLSIPINSKIHKWEIILFHTHK